MHTIRKNRVTVTVKVTGGPNRGFVFFAVSGSAAQEPRLETFSGEIIYGTALREPISGHYNQQIGSVAVILTLSAIINAVSLVSKAGQNGLGQCRKTQ